MLTFSMIAASLPTCVPACIANQPGTCPPSLGEQSSHYLIAANSSPSFSSGIFSRATSEFTASDRLAVAALDFRAGDSSGTRSFIHSANPSVDYSINVTINRLGRLSLGRSGTRGQAML